MNMRIENDRTINIRKEYISKKLLKALGSSAQTKMDFSEKEIEKSEIMKNVKQAHEEWADAQSSFEYARDQEMVDYCTYRIKACEIRYQYFIKKAREHGIIL